MPVPFFIKIGIVFICWCLPSFLLLLCVIFSPHFLPLNIFIVHCHLWRKFIEIPSQSLHEEILFGEFNDILLLWSGLCCVLLYFLIDLELFTNNRILFLHQSGWNKFLLTLSLHVCGVPSIRHCDRCWVYMDTHIGWHIQKFQPKPATFSIPQPNLYSNIALRLVEDRCKNISPPAAIQHWRSSL